MTRNWVLVTGASSGIGRETAVTLSRTCNVVLAGRDASRLADSVAACDASAKTLVWNFDLSRTDEVSASLASLLSDHAVRIAHFVHCAGVSKLLPVSVARPADLTDLLSVNTLAPLEIVKTLVSRRLNASALKSVVFVSSAAAIRGAKGYAVYGASKAALDGLMRGLSVELAPAVRVNSVLPGFVKSPMTAAQLEDSALVARIAARHPLGIGEPKSVADAVEFLLSDRASWITGQSLVVDGGATVDFSL